MIARRQTMAALLTGGVAAILAACTTTTTPNPNGGGSTTTVSIDMAKVQADGQAVLQALTASLASPAVVTALGPVNLMTAQGYLAKAKAALASISALPALSVNTASTQSVILTVVADATEAAQMVQAVLSSIGGNVTAAGVGNWVSAAMTLLPLIELAAGLAASPHDGATHMTEQQALAVAKSAH